MSTRNRMLQVRKIFFFKDALSGDDATPLTIEETGFYPNFLIFFLHEKMYIYLENYPNRILITAGIQTNISGRVHFEQSSPRRNPKNLTNRGKYEG